MNASAGLAADPDDLLNPGYLRDPFPALASLRSEDPVHWNSRFGLWMLTRHEDVRNAFQQPDVFGSDDSQRWRSLAERFCGPAEIGLAVGGLSQEVTG